MELYIDKLKTNDTYREEIFIYLSKKEVLGLISALARAECYVFFKESVMPPIPMIDESHLKRYKVVRLFSLRYSKYRRFLSQRYIEERWPAWVEPAFMDGVINEAFIGQDSRIPGWYE